MSRPTAESKTPFDLTRRQRVILFVAGGIFKIWSRTLRIELSPADRATLGRTDRPVALAMWHNRLFMSTEIIRRGRGGKPFFGLVSASKDGAWLVALFRTLGIGAIRGSSSWGAREAVNALIERLRAGDDIGITPDGPRGPCYEFKPGGLIVARRAGVPIILIGTEFSRFRQLRSWDGFVVPLPFSKVIIRAREVKPTDLPKDRDAALAQLTAWLQELDGPEPAPPAPKKNASA